ncbi:Kelch repeat-containing protein [Chondromyces crocatus]|uniref:Galactose oxidase n=1 Tax=Chondromyces crocatus TaxID=52 RepID=A0A0K1EAT6_CHOCO|nr:hypothetical protein [Chondromyces crocatus]AKT37792.1 uncharacterized protein CMC5_019340 [Chondromyces crocatus]
MSHAIRSLCPLLIAGLSLGCVIVKADPSPPSPPEVPDTGPTDPGHEPPLDPEDDPPPEPPGDCDPSIPSGWRSLSSSASAGLTRWLDRQDAIYAWTGSELLVHTGVGGAVYAPATDSWRPMASVGSRLVGAWAWSGDALFVKGVDNDTNAQRWFAYHPATDTWETLPPAPLLDFRGHSAVWSTTTHELLVWGGVEEPNTVDEPYITYDGGAAYDPATGTWRVLAPSSLSGRGFHGAIWNGAAMIVYGGAEGELLPLGDGAAYDPATDAWTSIASPTATLPLAPRASARTFVGGPSGSAAIFWGGNEGPCSHCMPFDRVDGGVYDAATDAWTKIPSLETSPLGSSGLRYQPSVWVGAGRLWVLGGIGGDEGPWGPFDNGVAYDLAAETWSTIPGGHVLGARRAASVVWTGCEAIFYGGLDADSDWLTDGAIYRP